MDFKKGEITMTIEEATHEWVRGFNAIDRDMIEELMECDEFDWEEVTESDDYNFEYGLPMWGTMWSFDDQFDNYWLEEENGIYDMSQCGFKIFKSEKYGYFFGIDSAGYDFYKAHWIPLYKIRGLHWHDEEEVEEEA